MVFLPQILLALLCAGAYAAPEGDAVDLGALNATYGGVDVGIQQKTWSGYLDIEANKSLHYMFIESQNSTDDPVLIWFNGGPGCSSLLGAFQENGPLIVDADGDKKFANNNYSWNARANVLYLEQPAGVGFSIARSEKAAQHSDFSQSLDTVAALKEWYKKFPEFEKNDLFISGESYGGIYVPYLTWQVYQYNLKVDVWNDINKKNSSWTPLTKINIKGFLVGNGVTNWDYDTTPSLPATLGGFDMQPNNILELYQQYACKVDFHGNVTGDDELFCEKLFNQMQSTGMPDVLNPYDLYRMIPDEEQMNAELTKPGLCLAKTHPWLKWRKDAHKVLISTANLTAWLNQNDTQNVLHVGGNNLTWVDCNGQMNSHWQFQDEASEWIYTVLKTSGYIRMLHYSGDTDGVLPTYGTKQWIEGLKWDKLGKYEMWWTGNQVSGFYQKYDGLDFLTVKGVGHMAPQWAREPMQNIINQWIHQENIFKVEQ